MATYSYLGGFLALVLASPLYATPALYQRIGSEVGVPANALYALAMTESGTTLTNGTVRPWPWTLNVNGKGYTYPNQGAACRALMIFLTLTPSVDIGLMQINWRWHKTAFDSPCQALEPVRNLIYASRLLKSAYAAEQDWGKAAGAYHRPAGGDIAKRYQARFLKHYQPGEH